MATKTEEKLEHKVRGGHDGASMPTDQVLGKPDYQNLNVAGGDGAYALPYFGNPHVDLSKLQLDGFTAKDAIDIIAESYLPKEIKSESGKVERVSPVTIRQREINDNVQSLEGIVKDQLGKGFKASHLEARKILKKLAYELAKAEGFTGKAEELSAEQTLNYITRAGQALGNSTIQSFTQFVESIANAPAARPGDPAYSREGDLGQFISYIATQKHAPSRRLQLAQTLLAQVYNKPGVGMAAIEEFSTRTGRPYAITATISEIIGDITQIGNIEAQRIAALNGKTYLKNPADITEHYAGQAKANAFGVHGRS